MSPASLKTEAIVLRSIRYGEADRILHLYTPATAGCRRSPRGRGAPAAASAPGSSRSCTSSVILHEGRGELHTVTGVDTVIAHAGLREHAATLDAAARACDAVARLFETADPHPEVFRLLANELALLDVDVAHARPRQRPRLPPQAAAGGRDRAPARIVRRMRRARAPAGLLRRRGRSRLRLVRGGRVPARRGVLHASWSARSAGRWLRPPRHPSGRCARPSARSARPPSTTPTCGCGRSWRAR